MTRISPFRIASRLVITISLLVGIKADGAQPVDFNRDIRPILSANCFKCHGIDEGGRKAKLRLDVREGVLATLKDGNQAIVPGKPDDSELIHRVFSDDDDEVMPPAKTGVKLTDPQKQLLKQWVIDGARYDIHWAFVPPKQGALPEVKQAQWCRNPLDRFVLAHLEEQGLNPSPEADRYELARRVYLDLIGIPPTVAEADAFVKDSSPGAYENLVDRLLASPHYGERWARRWLDLARYADTNGFEKDRQRVIWPYRDWVINAMNADMPFDQFTIEQLAGDMLPNATAQQRIATGFHRNTMLNEEGGIDPLEYRFMAMVDRISTTGTAWLGLTIGCAQCHTHKYDPLTQKEYYGLMAFLDNADEPKFEIPDENQAARRTRIEAQIQQMTDGLPEQFPANPPVAWRTPVATVRTANGSQPISAADGAWRFAGPSPDRDVYTFEFDSGPDAVDRIRLEALKANKAGPGRTNHGNFVLSEIVAQVAPKDAPQQVQTLKFVRAEADFSQRGYGVEQAIDRNPRTGWAIDPDDGLGIKPRTAIFYLEKAVQFAQGAHWTVRLEQNFGLRHTIAKLRLGLGSPNPQANTELASDGKSTQRATFDRALAKWESERAAEAVAWTVLRPTHMESSKPFLTSQPDGSILAGGDIAKSVTYDLAFQIDLAGITAVRLEALPDESLPGRGPGMVFYEGEPGDFILSEMSMQADAREVKFASVAQDVGNAAAAIDGNPQSGWTIGAETGKPHVAVFSLSEPCGHAGELKLHLLFERYFASPLGHFRISVTTDPRAARPHAISPEVESALAVPASARTADQAALLSRYFASVSPELAEARKPIERLGNELPRPTTTLVMRERPVGYDRPTFVHHRGEFLEPDGQVTAAVPAFLPQLPANVPANRLSFARWLVSRNNPLTARVQVNRQWQAFFGRGIVRTLQDFGYQGEMPTNPQLLDWLAVQFMSDGWSYKKLDRLVVTSATYRQSSLVTPVLLARDPDNSLLARGPRVRLEAELIRDLALKASDLLSEKIGGPSVFPPQPVSVTTEGAYGALAWSTSTGEDRYRRGLYTFSKRTAPFALYNTFDAPSGEACVARRDVSDSPLQALSLLNDTVFVEAAQAMGQVVANCDDDGDEARATDIFRRCLTRPPDHDEVTMLVEFARAQRSRFKSRELDARKVAGPGTGDPVERATWTFVARAVLNLDETVTKN